MTIDADAGRARLHAPGVAAASVELLHQRRADFLLCHDARLRLRKRASLRAERGYRDEYGNGDAAGDERRRTCGSHEADSSIPGS
jgi:hypothetical protein